MYKNKYKKCISLLLAVLIIASSLAVGCTAFAATGVSINEINFPDKSFRDIVKDVCDKDGNNYLDSTELSNTKVLSLSGYLDDDESIEDLKGIELFPNLSKLYCGDSALTTLDISQNQNLTTVRVGGNNLTSITIGYQPYLSQLICSANELTSIDVTQCPMLRDFQCNSNKLTSLNVSQNPNLNILYVQQNELTNVDVSNNPNLIYFYCSNNHLTELNLSRNINLDELTADEIGDQWITENAYIKSNKIYINHSFKDSTKLISSSLDTVVETDDGQTVAVAYNGSAFSTSEVTNIKNKLKNANSEVFDGFTYKYNVSNSACEEMSVNVVTDRNFYQVNYWLDEEHSVRLAYNLVMAGSNVTAPAVPDPPLCKKYEAWSDTADYVLEDKDIYIIWKDDHNVVKNINNTTGDIDIHCTKCDTKTIQFNFIKAYNSKKGDDNFVEIGDRNNDGVINAKDYAIIIKL